MNKNSTGTSPRQQAENPLVRIVYDPANALALLGEGVTKTIASFKGVKITNANELIKASGILENAEVEAEKVATFLNSLRERVQDAASQFSGIEGFTNFKVTLTVRNWDEWSQLQNNISGIKRMRAQFNADEQERVRKAQADADEKQRIANKKAADEAAALAKKQGADKQTVQDIKETVMATPAPIVETKAQVAADAVGAGLRFKYTAKITSLSQFLTFCLSNPVVMPTLAVAIPDIEKAFQKMAGDQKEKFTYPGVTFIKTPVDVARRG